MKYISSLISVIIPVYNGDRYLAEAIESILAQNYEPLEIIIVDDGSTDNSANIAKGFMPKIQYYYQPHSGTAASPLNYGISLCKGDFISFLDADDLWLLDKLKLQIQCFRREPDLDLVFGYVQQFISPELDDLTKQRFEIPKKVIQGYSKGAMLIRRDSFFKVGYFNVNLERAEFIDWYIKAHNLELKMAIIPEIVLKRRIHQTNTGIVKKDKSNEYLSVIKKVLDQRKDKSLGNFHLSEN